MSSEAIPGRLGTHNIFSSILSQYYCACCLCPQVTIPQKLSIVCDHSWLMARLGNSLSQQLCFATKCHPFCHLFFSCVADLCTLGKDQGGAILRFAPTLQGMKLMYLMLWFKPILVEKRDITPKWLHHTYLSVLTETQTGFDQSQTSYCAHLYPWLSEDNSLLSLPQALPTPI